MPAWVANVCIVVVLAGFVADTLRGFPSAPVSLWLFRAVGFVILFVLVPGTPGHALLGPGFGITNPGAVRFLQVFRLIGLAGLAYVAVGLAVWLWR